MKKRDAAVNPADEEAFAKLASPVREKLPVDVALVKNSVGIVAPPDVEALFKFV